MPRWPEDRFWPRVNFDGPNGCWDWTGPLQKGYGRTFWNGRQQAAHRVSWEMANGSIPDGLFVCHRCDRRCCVNPAHLFLGDQLANVADMLSKQRHWNQKTHCIRGHEFTPENTYVQVRAGKPIRRCKTCVRAWEVKNRRRRTAMALSRRHGTGSK